MRHDFFSPRPDAELCDVCSDQERSTDLWPCRYCMNVRSGRAMPAVLRSLDIDRPAVQEYLRAQDADTLSRWEHDGPTQEERNAMQEAMYGTD